MPRVGKPAKAWHLKHAEERTGLAFNAHNTKGSSTRRRGSSREEGSSEICIHNLRCIDTTLPRGDIHIDYGSWAARDYCKMITYVPKQILLPHYLSALLIRDLLFRKITHDLIQLVTLSLLFGSFTPTIMSGILLLLFNLRVLPGPWTPTPY